MGEFDADCSYLILGGGLYVLVVVLLLVCVYHMQAFRASFYEVFTDGREDVTRKYGQKVRSEMRRMRKKANEMLYKFRSLNEQVDPTESFTVWGEETDILKTDVDK